MATSISSEARHEDWTELRAAPTPGPLSTRAAWLWTVFGIALLCVFLAFVVVDFPLKSLIAAN
jgi:hypothetical protein